MDNMLTYLLEVAGGSTLLYLCFLVFYRDDTFYRRNRMMLLLTIAIPLIIPAIRVTVTNVTEPAIFSQGVMSTIISSGIRVNESVAYKINSLAYTNVLFWLWLIVSTFLLARIGTGIIQTLLVIGKGEIISGNKLKVVVSDISHPPFSFYPYVVIPREIYENGKSKEIIAHEEAHISQMHTFDLLLSEVFIAFFWFNPASWFIRRSIVLNHEYLADNETIHKTISIKEYQYMLLNISTGFRSIPLAHTFNSNLKKRIIMINKKSTRIYAASKNILILPAVMILLFLFSFRSNQQQQERSSQTLFSGSSQMELVRFINMNISYPTEAKEKGISGAYFLVIKIAKGGHIKKITANSNDNSINVPLVTPNEFNVIAYRPSATTDKSIPEVSNEDLTLIKNEGIRVAKMIETLKLPEWQNKSIEFAIAFNFQLK
jgi:bla regulator protein BlaR1